MVPGADAEEDRHGSIARDRSRSRGRVARALWKDAGQRSIRPIGNHVIEVDMARYATRAPRRGPLARRMAIGGVLVAGVVVAGGCSGTLEDVWPDRKPSYKSSRGAPPLEVPPDLTRSSIRDSLSIPQGEATTYSRYSGGDGAGTGSAQAVLPEIEDARIERSGNERWLVVATPPEVLWPRLRDFWNGQGFVLEVEEPAAGVMETNWAEKRTRLPGGVIKEMLSRVSDAFYGVTVRDRFRTRLERGSESGTTEVHVSHRGAEQIVVGDENSPARREGYAERAWQPRPSDPGLEAEMLTRLMVFLGADEQRADALAAAGAASGPLARIVREDGGAAALTLGEGFSQAWRRTGIVLDRTGFAVDDRDRSRGVFFVRYADPEAGAQHKEGGWFSRLKFWGDDAGSEKDGTYLIQLSEEAADVTRVVVLDEDGEREGGPTAERILSLLHEQLK